MNRIMYKDAQEYKVIEKTKESDTITTLRLIPLQGAKPVFISGQFLTVYFPELGVAEGKAYSLSSSPHEQTLSISVKEIGAYSRKLASMEIGETIHATGPYGFFYSEEEGTPLVLVAGGIGVAPFRSMIVSRLREGKGRKISLYYSVPSRKEGAFLDELLSLQEGNKNLSIIIHTTKEASDAAGVQRGRISVDELFEEFVHDKNTEYLICGSISFTRDMWKGLRGKGVPEERLYTEAFFS